MSRAIVEISLESAAFWHEGEFDPAPEVARLLRQLASEIERDQPTAKILRDVNGNDVGQFEMDCGLRQYEVDPHTGERPR